MKSSIIKYRLANLFLLFAFAGSTTAQDSLFLQATYTGKAVELAFIPLNPAAWASNIAPGYQVDRMELDSLGRDIPSTSALLSARLVPRDSAWFAQQKNEEDGLMEAVGALLYDASFQFADKSLLDPDAMRWSYVMNEVLNRPAIAVACGLGLVDSTAQPGKTYRYTVTDLSDFKSGSVILPTGEIQTVTSPPGFEPAFKFPEDKSLSDMLPKPPLQDFPQVFAIGKAYGDSIVVRWAPNMPRLWKSSNESGYLLLRHVGDEDPGVNTFFEDMDTLGVIKPMPQAEAIALDAKIGSDSMLTLAVSLLYNEIAIEGTMSAQADAFETLHGMALFAAEKSKAAADVLGFRYVDKDVQPGKHYVYSVISMANPFLFSQGYVSLKNERKQEGGPVKFQQGEPGDLVINLHWDKGLNEQQFSAYELERSDDKGKTWKPLTAEPLVFMEMDGETLPNFSYRDSVAQNNHEYRYRLRGLNSFAEWSGWEEVKAKAVDLTPPPQANIIFANYNDTTNMATIRWEVEELPADFKQFNVLLSAADAGPFDTLTVLGKDAREFIWKPDSLLVGDRSHFIWVQSIDKSWNKTLSLNRYMTVPDLVSPEPPAKVAGRIDGDGTVWLVWEHSLSKDVAGYWVYFANNPDHEFSILNTEPLPANAFEWKVKDESLNRTAYFVVSAQDRAANRSYPSKVLALKRPDKVPPIPAFMEVAKQEGGTVKLKWTRSTSEDCRLYHLLRKEVVVNSPGWALLDSLNAQTDSYSDSTCLLNWGYQYALVALDDSGNHSDTSNVVAIKMHFQSASAAVKNLRVSQSEPEVAAVQLSWEFELPVGNQLPAGAYEFLIYRSSGNDNPELLTTVPSNQQDYTDMEALNGVIYNYAVQVHYVESGELGQRSPVKSVLTKGQNDIQAEQAAGTAPARLVLRGRGRTIANADDSPTLEDDTDFGKVGTGSVAAHIFSIQNTGEVDFTLPGQPVTLEGEKLEAWAIVQPRTKVRGYGNSEVFTIEFRPKKEGEFSATVRIAGEKPQSFSIKGIGTRKPELDVQGNGLAILNLDASPNPDDNTDFGGVSTGAKATRIFMVKNIGVDPLRLNGTPTLKGDPAFSITNFVMPKNGTLAAGADLSLFITFLPLETGVHNAKVNILSDDDDENPFVFNIQGVGAGPEVSMFGETEALIANGATTASLENGTDFGSIATRSANIKRFVIQNQGDRALNLTGRPRIAISGPHASEFKVVTEPPAAVKPGDGTETFTIEFRPKTLGLKKAIITVENNDANEGNYQFTIQGTGL